MVIVKQGLITPVSGTSEDAQAFFLLSIMVTDLGARGCRDGTPLTSEEVVAIEQRRAVAQAAQAARIKVGFACCVGFSGLGLGCTASSRHALVSA